MKYLRFETMKPINKKAQEMTGLLDWIMQNLGPEQDPPEEDVSLSHTEIRVLDALGTQGSLPMGQLAEIVGLAVSSATAAADRMILKGLVMRHRSEEDRRIVYVSLAENGKRFYKHMLEGRMKMSQTILNGLSEPDQERMIKLFRKVVTHYQNDNEIERKPKLSGTTDDA